MCYYNKKRRQNLKGKIYKKLLLISNTGTKNVVGLVQCFQAEARRKHISLERELINVGLIRKGAFLSQIRKNNL
jgi:hypothetical protein